MLDCKALSIRKNDQVQVMSGKEKGKTGKVLMVDRKTGRITIEKVNMVNRHVKPSQKYPQGGILQKEGSLHYSTVLLMCAKCNRGVRHGHKEVEAGGAKKKGKTTQSEAGAHAATKKIRVCKRCGESLEATA